MNLKTKIFASFVALAALAGVAQAQTLPEVDIVPVIDIAALATSVLAFAGALLVVWAGVKLAIGMTRKLINKMGRTG